MEELGLDERSAKEPATAQIESALRIAPVSKKPPPARKNPEG